MLRRLQGGPVPTLLGHDGPRILMAATPGRRPVRRRPARAPDDGVATGRAAGGRGSDGPTSCVAMRLPDWRSAALTSRDRGRRGAAWGCCQLPRRATSRGLTAFVGRAPARFAAVAGVRACRTRSCTATSTRATARGDGAVDHAPRLGRRRRRSPAARPGLDGRRDPRDGRGVTRPDPLARRVAGRRSRRPIPRVPPSLLEPVAAARHAVIFQRFVDGIEPVERRSSRRRRDRLSLQRTARLLIAGG